MKKTKTPSLVTLAIFTVITIMVWIGFTVARIFISKSSPQIPSEILAPLDPTYDKQTVDKIIARLYFESGQNLEPQVASSSASPTAKTSPTATPTASASATPVATGSGAPTQTP